jgi:hypothetical protein
MATATIGRRSAQTSREGGADVWIDFGAGGFRADRRQARREFGDWLESLADPANAGLDDAELPWFTCRPAPDLSREI